MVKDLVLVSIILLFISSCNVLGEDFKTIAEVEAYISKDLATDSQILDSDTILEVATNDFAESKIRILQTGNLYWVEDKKYGGYTVRAIHNLTPSREAYPFHKPCKGRDARLMWSNATHHTAFLVLDHIQFEPGKTTLKVVRNHSLRGEDLTDLSVKFTYSFPAGRRLCIVGSNGVCRFVNNTTLCINNLLSQSVANNGGVIQLYWNRCQVAELPIQVTHLNCTKDSVYCKKTPIVPDHVLNTSGQIKGHNLTIRWSPPNQTHTAPVMAYVIRWGFPDELPQRGGQEFVIGASRDVYFLPLYESNHNLTEYEHVFELSNQDMYEFGNESSSELAVQVVALDETRAQMKSTFDKMSHDMNNQTYIDLLDELFGPQRIDVAVPHPAELEDSGLHEDGIEPEERLNVVSGTPGSSPKTKDTTSEVLSVVIPVMVVAVIVGAVISALVYRKHANKKVRRRVREKRVSKALSRMSQNPLYRSIYLDVSEADKWEIDPDTIEWGDEIGTGAFGCVYRCTLLDAKSQLHTVAVKTTAADSDELARQQFIQEILVMKQLEAHPNILQLIGCITSSDPVCLVMEHAVNGDLLSYLQSQRTTQIPDYVNREVCEVNGVTAVAYRYMELKETLLSMAVDVASGMEFICSKGYIHRDLAARNLLLDEHFTVKIADFGLSRYVHADDIYVVQNNKRLPVKWLSIEALSDATFSSASDVWAFGIVLYELVTLGSAPYPTLDPMDILKFLSADKRMEKPDGCDDKLYRLMLNCWKTKPIDRPTFTDLKETLLEMWSECTGYEAAEVTELPTCVTQGSLTSTTESNESDEGIGEESPRIVRAPHISESSNYSDTSMIIDSPMEDQKFEMPDPFTQQGKGRADLVSTTIQVNAASCDPDKSDQSQISRESIMFYSVVPLPECDT